MLDRGLRRRCLAMVRSLALPQPWDFDEFCGRLEQQRGRALRLMPLPLAEGLPCGLCISAGETDYIYYAQGTTEMHQEHIALHEIGHLLGEHVGDMSSVDLAALLMPNLDPAMVVRMLGRTGYSTDEEKEAETFASLVLGRAIRHDAQFPTLEVSSLGPVLLETLDRLSLTLESPVARRVANA